MKESGSKVTSLDRYRSKRNREFRRRYRSHLNRFVECFVREHCPFDIERLQAAFIEHQRSQNQAAWDYVEFRELLFEALIGTMSERLAAALAEEWWYDRRWLRTEDVLDMCITRLVLRQPLGQAHSQLSGL